jgi:hypothetical protein
VRANLGYGAGTKNHAASFGNTKKFAEDIRSGILNIVVAHKDINPGTIGVIYERDALRHKFQSSRSHYPVHFSF